MHLERYGMTKYLRKRVVSGKKNHNPGVKKGLNDKRYLAKSK